MATARSTRHDQHSKGGNIAPVSAHLPVRRQASALAARRLIVWLLAVGLAGVAVVSASAAPGHGGTPRQQPATPLDCGGPNPPLLCTARPSNTASPTPIPSASTAAASSTSPVPPACTGEGCIPQPTVPPPPQSGTQPGGDGTSAPECGITNISGCMAAAINSVFTEIVDAALGPILDLLGHSVLTTPTLDQLPGIGELWQNSWEIVVACYGLLIIIAGIVLMAHETVQTRYSIKEIGPRIPVGFLASALSLFFVEKFIVLANALSQAMLGDANPPSLGATMQDAIHGAESGGLFLILLCLVLVVVGLGLLLVYVVRVVITVILIVSGPLFLMFHCLPHTDGLARWWWKALGATLAIQVGQALVLATAIRTFLSSGVHLFGSTLSALATLLSTIALFFVLFKIPFWFLSAVKVGSGRSFLGSLVRAYIAAKTFGAVSGKTFGASAGTKAGAAVDTGTGSNGGGAATRGGGDPPWPPVPRMAPTSAGLNKRLHEQRDAERQRAARQPRSGSHSPTFLQPTPQTPTHDPAVMPANKGSVMPDFSSAPQRQRATPSPQGRAAPQFRAAHNATGDRQTLARPIRTAAVPPQLRFQAPTSEPTSRPVKASSAPAPAEFRPPQPGPKVGDARRRTHTASPIEFRGPRLPAIAAEAWR